MEQQLLREGDRVIVDKGMRARGIVVFVGRTHFAPGEWVGIHLESPAGKNDGSVMGTRYFHCAPQCGMFVRPTDAAVRKMACQAPREASAERVASPVRLASPRPTSPRPTSPRPTSPRPTSPRPTSPRPTSPSARRATDPEVRKVASPRGAHRDSSGPHRLWRQAAEQRRGFEVELEALVSDAERRRRDWNARRLAAARPRHGSPRSRRATVSLPEQEEWRIAQWLGSAVGEVVSEALLQQVSNRAAPGMELALAQALGGVGTPLISWMLRSADLDARVAAAVSESARKLGEQSASTGKELSTKFAADGAFELSYGPTAIFSKGLDYLIGSPSVDVMRAMEEEHQSEKKWTTGNYGVTTSPRIEWHFVAHPEDGLSMLGLAAWPRERDGVLADHSRQPRPLPELRDDMEELNMKLSRLNERNLMEAEIYAARLYTGPMFEHYNAQNRGGALPDEVKQPEFMRKMWQEKSDGVRYTTTIHAISSALIKMSKLSKVQTVFRGMAGGVLPKEFWDPGPSGSRGGVEFGFLSTTLDREVAMGYASGRGCGTVLEMRTGAVDRGADLSCLSQYPHEKEICFPPLTNLEVTETRVDGGLLVVLVRLNVNMKALTIEEVTAKRKGIVVDMARSLGVQMRDEISTIREKHFELCKHLESVVDKSLKRYSDGEPQYYNDIRNFHKTLKDLIDDDGSVEVLCKFVQHEEFHLSNVQGRGVEEILHSIQRLKVQPKMLPRNGIVLHDLHDLATVLKGLRSQDASKRKYFMQKLMEKVAQLKISDSKVLTDSEYDLVNAALVLARTGLADSDREVVQLAGLVALHAGYRGVRMLKTEVKPELLHNTWMIQAGEIILGNELEVTTLLDLEELDDDIVEKAAKIQRAWRRIIAIVQFRNTRKAAICVQRFWRHYYKKHRGRGKRGVSFVIHTLRRNGSKPLASKPPEVSEWRWAAFELARKGLLHRSGEVREEAMRSVLQLGQDAEEALTIMVFGENQMTESERADFLRQLQELIACDREPKNCKRRRTAWSIHGQAPQHKVGGAALQVALELARRGLTDTSEEVRDAAESACRAAQGECLQNRRGSVMLI